MSDEQRIVVLVGHCRPDAWALATAVRSALGEVDVRNVDDESALEPALDGAHLLLVNRVLDGHFSNASGLDLIRALAADGAPPVMLVSNHDDAQADAEAAGALPGFGKLRLYDPSTRERIADAFAR